VQIKSPEKCTAELEGKLHSQFGGHTKGMKDIATLVMHRFDIM